MFETTEFRIQFQRVNVDLKSGRYDTLCNIYRKGEFESDRRIPICSGLAILHPNDVPNKIIGKKIALSKVIPQVTTLNLFKFKRKEIWNAFWKWIASWNDGNIKVEKCNVKR